MKKIINQNRIWIISLLLIFIIHIYFFYSDNTFLAYYILSLIFIKSVILTYFISRIVMLYVKNFIYFMFNSRNKSYDKMVERPRLAVHITLLPIILSSILFFTDSYSKLNENYNTEFFKQVILIFLFLISSRILILSWSESFKSKIIPKIENKLDEINYDFKIDLEKVVLEKTFDILKENNLIKNINDLDAIPNKEKFVDILISGKLPEEKVFKLELDNIQTKYLYEKIKINSKSLTLGKFLKIFGNKNENAKSKTISSSKSNSKIETPKNIEILNQLF
ncbi:hypothetical protein [Flavobacterium psychraquaticum]|uniref:hypothetical protein n=1 Tax=Flavobacterium psychraquaticum TaxID=3103958 RepID=UPI002ACD6C5D|nr:hypothetical protein [Flavobacterium sp. LB-N7T]